MKSTCMHLVCLNSKYRLFVILTILARTVTKKQNEIKQKRRQILKYRLQCGNTEHIALHLDSSGTQHLDLEVLIHVL